MQYISTRGDNAAKSFNEILYEAFAPDGGLYVPAVIPRISKELLRTWKGLPYASLAFEVFRLFAPSYPKCEAWRLCNEAYDSMNFPNSRDVFDDDCITPITWLHDDVGIFELSTGPTLAFDDLSMQFLARLYGARAEPNVDRRILFGATTGDMGVSAECAFAGSAGIDVIMLSPRGRMSRFQSAQLYSCTAPNVTNIEIDGTFDDCQTIVNTILRDHAWCRARKLSAINNVLWVREIMQVASFIYGYLKAVRYVGEEIVFVVPAGNLGNAYACWTAREMGVPIYKIIVSSNENDAFDTFMRTGRYHPRATSETLATSSPSTDIARGANLERFLFEVLDRDAARVCELARELEEKGEFQLKANEIKKLRQSGLESGTSNHANRMEIMELMHLEYDVCVDPHTADALFTGIYLHPVGMKTLCVESVQPAKFTHMFEQVTGCRFELPEKYRGVLSAKQFKIEMASDEKLVRDAINGIIAKRV